MHSLLVPINVRCYSNSDIIFRCSEVTLWAKPEVDRGPFQQYRRFRRSPLAKERAERRLTAILAADVAGYSRLMGSDEEGTLAQLKAHRRALVDPKIKQHRGRIVKTTGDGMLVEFASVVEAVCCAVDIQNGMVKRNAELPQEKRIEFRVGINLGDIMIDGNDIFGDGVNVAARLEAIAEPGGIFISRQVYDQIEGKVAFQFRKLGPRDLKNIAKPVEVFAIDGIGRSTNGRSLKVQRQFRRSNIVGHLTGYVSPMRSQAAGQFW